MYKDIILYHNGHFDENCYCSFCLNRRGIKRGFENLGFNVFTKTLRCDWNFYYPANIHFDYALRFQNKIFGSFMFESNKFPKKIIDFSEKYFDYIICGSKFLVNTWKNSGIGEKYLIHSGCGIDTSIYRINNKVEEIYPNKFKFLIIGAWQGGIWEDRKGMLLTINLFQKLFNNNSKVMLIIKTNDKEAKKYENNQIKIILDKYNDFQMANLYQSCAKNGAYIHPHKGEGFGRTVLEALHCGMNIGATNYSGVLDFLNSDNSTLFNYKLIPHNIYPKEYYKNEELPLFANPNFDEVMNWMLKISKTIGNNKNSVSFFQHTWYSVTNKLLLDIKDRI